MHFYELHEGDNDMFADLLLAREDEMEAEEFFEVVHRSAAASRTRTRPRR